MRTIIAGSRSCTDMEQVEKAISLAGWTISRVISGGARGVDQLGEAWANNINVPVDRFIPNWQVLGKKAGYVRNVEMATFADALIALWDGESRGTKHMIDIAIHKGLVVLVWRV